MVQKIYCQAKDGKWCDVLVDKKTICPWCERTGEENVIVWETRTLSDEDENYCGELTEFVFRCRHTDCSRLFVAEYYLDPNLVYEVDGSEFSQSYPPQPLPDVSELLQKLTMPEDVKLDLDEAAGCMKNRLYQAFGAMARRTVHSICADKHAVGGDLQVQIESLRANGTFSDDIADRAQELRTFGRQGAHPEWERIDKTRAESGLDLLVWVVKTVYQAPPPTDAKWRQTAKRRYTVPKK